MRPLSSPWWTTADIPSLSNDSMTRRLQVLMSASPKRAPRQWILFFQWRYASSQSDMLADFVGAEYSTAVTFRMLLVPAATTLTALICFWSVGISLAIISCFFRCTCFRRNPGARNLLL